jgi:hypothetical protein
MKIAGTITKWLLGAALAGTLFVAVPKKADAQVVVSAEAGNFVRPGLGFYAPVRYDNWRRHEFIERERRDAYWRHERFERERFHDRRFDRGYGRRY